MGGGFSVPVPYHPDLGYVAVGLRQFNNIKVLHGPSEVVRSIEKICREVNVVCNNEDKLRSSNKNGFQELKLIGCVFAANGGRVNSTAGKLFMIRLYEEMYRLGYDPVVSSDLVRQLDQATIFFKKVAVERPGRKVTCLAPGNTDKLVLMRAEPDFINAVRAAIIEAWTDGIQSEESYEVGPESIMKFKLRGNPWLDFEGASNYRCRRMVLKMLSRLGQLSYKLISGSNIKGTTDTLFFFKDDNYRITDGDMCMVSLNHSDRVRLIECVEMADTVASTIERNGNTIQRRENKHGGYEFKIEGTPWHCTGEEAVASRRLICRIAETFINQGWALTGGLDLSRRPNDKSVLLFTRVVPFVTKFACISLSSTDKMRIVDFPEDITQALASRVTQHYVPGVQREGSKDESCYQIKLNGHPWSSNIADNTYARSMMVEVLKEATYRSWQLVCSADVSASYVHQENGPDYPVDVHSWFFVYWPAGTSQL